MVAKSFADVRVILPGYSSVKENKKVIKLKSSSGLVN